MLNDDKQVNIPPLQFPDRFFLLLLPVGFFIFIDNIHDLNADIMNFA